MEHSKDICKKGSLANSVMKIMLSFTLDISIVGGYWYPCFLYTARRDAAQGTDKTLYHAHSDTQTNFYSICNNASTTQNNKHVVTANRYPRA